MSVYVLPVLLVLLFVYCAIKKVRPYECFLSGTKDALSLVKDVFPYIATIFVCISLFKESGLSSDLATLLAKPLDSLGIPSEIIELTLLVPLSGNGTTALLQEIITKYGADSYEARCACVIAGGSETIFYICAVYLSACKAKKLRYTIPVSLFATILGALIACLLCKVM